MATAYEKVAGVIGEEIDKAWKNISNSRSERLSRDHSV